MKVESFFQTFKGFLFVILFPSGSTPLALKLLYTHLGFCERVDLVGPPGGEGGVLLGDLVRELHGNGAVASLQLLVEARLEGVRLVSPVGGHAQ